MREAVALEKRFIARLPAGRGRRPQRRGVLDRTSTTSPTAASRASAWSRCTTRAGEPAALAGGADGRAQGAELLRGPRHRVPEGVVAGRSSPTRSSRSHGHRLRRDPAATSSSSARPRCRAEPAGDRRCRDARRARRARRRRGRRRGAAHRAPLAGDGRRRAGGARASRAASGGRHGRRAARSSARPPPTSLARLARRRARDHRPRPLAARRGGADRRRLLRRRQGARAAPRAADAASARADAPRADPPLGRGRGMGHGQDRGRRSARRSCRSGLDSAPAVALAARVGERARALGTAYVPIETVQDIVQEELVLAGHMRVAERYIVYRAERAMLRARGDVEPATPRRDPGASRPTARAAGRRRPARADRVRVDRARPAAGRRRARARAAARHPARASPAQDLPRLVVLNAKALIGARRRVLALRRPHPAVLRLRGDARLGHRRATASARCKPRTSAALRPDARATA